MEKTACWEFSMIYGQTCYFREHHYIYNIRTAKVGLEYVGKHHKNDFGHVAFKRSFSLLSMNLFVGGFW